MQQIQNVIFDLGGVLLNLDFQRTEDAFVRMGIKNFKELFTLTHATSLFKDYEVGAISDDSFVQQLQQQAGNAIDRQAIIDAWNALLLDFPEERITLLKNLSNKYRLFLFSNTNALHLQAFHQTYRNAYGGSLDDLFEKAYYSHLIKLRKPAREAFDYVVKDSGLDPAHTVFIDDSLANVEGAMAAGLQGILLAPGKTILDLGW